MPSFSSFNSAFSDTLLYVFLMSENTASKWRLFANDYGYSITDHIMKTHDVIGRFSSTTKTKLDINDVAV